MYLILEPVAIRTKNLIETNRRSSIALIQKLSKQLANYYRFRLTNILVLVGIRKNTLNSELSLLFFPAYKKADTVRRITLITTTNTSFNILLQIGTLYVEETTGDCQIGFCVIRQLIIKYPASGMKCSSKEMIFRQRVSALL